MLTWPRLICLLRYWNEHPPVSEALHGIAVGMSGGVIRSAAKHPTSSIAAPDSNRIENAEQLFALLPNVQGYGITAGVINERR